MYLAARLEVLTLGEDALVVVDVVLPAVLRLVLVREASVEAWHISVPCCLLLNAPSRICGMCGGGREMWAVVETYRLRYC